MYLSVYEYKGKKNFSHSNTKSLIFFIPLKKLL